jgi:hypothetical protein
LRPQNVCTILGYLQKVRNAATTSTVYWLADTMNAERQILQFTHGNGKPGQSGFWT